MSTTVTLQSFSISILQVEVFLHSLPLLNIYVMALPFFLQHFLRLLVWLCFTSPAPGCTSHLYLICSSAPLVEHRYSLQSSVKSLVLITLCCFFLNVLWDYPQAAHLHLISSNSSIFVIFAISVNWCGSCIPVSVKPETRCFILILPNRHPLCCHIMTHCFFPSVFLYFRANNMFLNL